MSRLPGTRLGSYEVLGAIGAGGMGEVYRAPDTRLNRDVAIKVLPELFAADLRRHEGRSILLNQKPPSGGSPTTAPEGVPG